MGLLARGAGRAVVVTRRGRFLLLPALRMGLMGRLERV